MSKHQSIDGRFERKLDDTPNGSPPSSRQLLSRRVTDDYLCHDGDGMGASVVCSRKRSRDGQSISVRETPVNNNDDNEFPGLLDDDAFRQIDETPFKRKMTGQSSAESTTKVGKSSRTYYKAATLSVTPLPSKNSNNMGISRSSNAINVKKATDSTNQGDPSSQAALSRGTQDEFAAIPDEAFLDLLCPTTDTPSRIPKAINHSSSGKAGTFTTGHRKSSHDSNRDGYQSTGNLCSNVAEDVDGDNYDADLHEDLNIRLTVDQLTQEVVDFDSMYKPRSADDTNELIVEELEADQQGGPVVKVANDNGFDESKALRQPTMSQFYARETESTRSAPTIAKYVEYNGRHFFRSDIWRLDSSNLIVQIENFSKEKLSGSMRRRKMANVKNKFHLAIKNLPCLSIKGAQRLIEYWKAKGITGPEYVQCEWHQKLSIPRFPLSQFEERITKPIVSDLIYRSFRDKQFTFKYKPSALHLSEKPAIPTTPEGKLRVLDLYAGAGGFSQGLKDAGFHVSHHVDSDTASCSTLQANFSDSKVFQCSVQDFLAGCRHNPKSTRYPPQNGFFALIHGSSPCQGFSSANRNGGANDDANNSETFTFMEAVKYFQPPFVTFENVEGITHDKHKRYLHKMTEEFLKMDYQIRELLLTASDYGDAQNRTRFFILASKKGLKLPRVPNPTHGDDASVAPRRTTKDALQFLEDISPLAYEGEVKVQFNGVPLSLQGHKFKEFKPNEDDVKLKPHVPAPTVIKKRVILHYKNNNRQLTRLERAQLQSFPPTYKFYGTDSEIRDQIGNAVPICLARAIGSCVMEAILRSGEIN